MQAPQDNSKITIAVTGASGFIAGELIFQLLAKGYRVKGSVRDVTNETKTKHLKESFPKLELFQADLLNEGSFDKAFEGCDYVMHTASPFQLEVADPQRDLVDPAVNGTKNVLGAALKAGTVKRVVLTSSVAAVISEAVPPADKIWAEDDWNRDSTLSKGPYRLSKRLAEEAAWSFVGEHPQLELVVINPTFIVGPPHSSRVDSTSVRVVKQMLSGELLESGTKPVCLGCVDVRDVARAHINAMEMKEAKGRYLITSTEGFSHLELATMLKEAPEFSHYPLPDKAAAPFSYRPKFSSTKAERELGITYISIPQSLVDMGRKLVELGVVERREKK